MIFVNILNFDWWSVRIFAVFFEKKNKIFFFNFSTIFCKFLFHSKWWTICIGKMIEKYLIKYLPRKLCLNLKRKSQSFLFEKKLKYFFVDFVLKWHKFRRKSFFAKKKNHLLSEQDEICFFFWTIMKNDSLDFFKNFCWFYFLR